MFVTKILIAVVASITHINALRLLKKQSAWVSGAAYVAGDQVIGSDGVSYECREYPNSSWCPQYDPTAWYGLDAWTELTNSAHDNQSQSDCPDWQANQHWHQGACCTRYGRIYACREWPYSGWCPTYDPSSMYGQDAWELIGGTSICREWEAGMQFGAGDCTIHIGKTYYCKPYPENGWCPYYEPSGIYGHLAWLIDEYTDPQPDAKTDPTPAAECTGDGLWTGNDWESINPGLKIQNGCVTATTDSMQRILDASRANRNPPSIDLNDITNNPQNVQNAMNAFGQDGFAYIFPIANKVYTQENFYKALSMYPAICGEVGPYSDITDPVELCKKEIATMVAHFAQETGANWPGFQSIQEKWRQSLYYLTEGECATTNAGSTACDYYQATGWAATSYPRAFDTTQYFGRGAKQVSWNYNYGPFSKVIFDDVNVLLENPERVAQEGWLATVSAFWFYSSPQSPKPSMHDVVSGFWKANSADESAGISAGFGATINIINGAIECGKWTQNAANRIENYQGLMGYFQIAIPDTETLNCSAMQSFPSDGAGAILSYWDQDWSNGNKCQLVKWQTPHSLWIEGDYKACVDTYF